MGFSPGRPALPACAAQKRNLVQTPSKTAQIPRVNPPSTLKLHKTPINTGDFSPPTLAYLPPPTHYNRDNPKNKTWPHPTRPSETGMLCPVNRLNGLLCS